MGYLAVGDAAADFANFKALAENVVKAMVKPKLNSPVDVLYNAAAPVVARIPANQRQPVLAQARSRLSKLGYKGNYFAAIDKLKFDFTGAGAPKPAPKLNLASIARSTVPFSRPVLRSPGGGPSGGFQLPGSITGGGGAAPGGALQNAVTPPAIYDGVSSGGGGGGGGGGPIDDLLFSASAASDRLTLDPTPPASPGLPSLSVGGGLMSGTMGKVVLVGAIGAAGYFAWRHFGRKKRR
jgi:hypothetical protein